MAYLYLSLGSNLGDRHANLLEASERLRPFLGYPMACTGELETEAIGFEGPRFLNQVIVFSCSLDPYRVLAICKETERAMGRTDTPEYDRSGRRIFHSRIIDIDILKYGDLVMDSETLTVPHPQVDTRPFVRELLAELGEIQA